MNKAISNFSHAVQRKTVGMFVDTVLKQVDKDREKGFLEAVDLAEQFWGRGFSREDYDKSERRLRIRILNGFVTLIGCWMRPTRMWRKQRL